MNSGVVIKTLGRILIFEAAALFPSLFISLYSGGSDFNGFLLSIVIIASIGGLFLLPKPKKSTINYKEGFAIVAFGWIIVSILGALPFIFTGTFDSFADAFFETASGFSTTGATVLNDIEVLPKGILFWRSFTHWLGGMGILVLTLALLPAFKTGALQIYKAESPGPTPTKLVPRLGQTAQLLYGVYILITVIQVIVLYFAGMPLFEACVHTFGTVGTGGFSTKNASIGAYNNVVFEIIIFFFMFVSGANFTLHYQALHGNFKSLIKDSEFKFYIFVIAASIAAITLNLWNDLYLNILEALRHASFQVVSIITTTGYATANFDVWPNFSKIILVMLMFIGGCSGSTAGGIKHIRLLLLFKYAKREFSKLLHPKAVIPVKLGGKRVPEETLSSVVSFFFLHITIFFGATLLISFEDMDLVSTVTSVVTTLGNVGPGLGMVGPSMNFGHLSGFSKTILSICMIMGRLELYTILILVVPGFWKKSY